ncbi:DUF5313 domain-containing protein [Umezawaea sp. Da 62-37]|uniref:DUF5313 domain-containing protein n=1 Tax=Umezawaea sp. Da 62-37 TaxID=3075927 RepID=UPI0028F6EC4D|nr:DUF5313 domain-containing protein [Umezawaea sp. Da 62-37]WNV82686.1 DUF5313 domain-containing protein [Umezawaea sp. Da 62-37]
MTRSRPGPVLWLWYAVGGRLPDRHREWVLHDVTARTWVVRHLVRGLVQMSPIFLLVLLPGPLWVRLLSCLLGILVGFFYSVSYMEQTTEQRLVKQGYPRGTGRATRRAAHSDEDARVQAAYEARYRP